MRSTPRLLVVALLLLGIGWAVAPRSALPLYDGVGFPDEPYRFVKAPAGAPSTKPPSTAHGGASVRGGRNGSLVATSAETGPQVSLQIPSGSLRLPSGTTRVSVSAAPAGPLPTVSGQYLWSNVYLLASSPHAQLRAGQLQATVTLRAATAQQPAPHIAYYDAGQWHRLPTFAEGRDIYTAELTRFTRFAVIGTVPLDVTKLPGYRSHSGRSPIGVIVGGAALVAVVGLYLLGRRRRSQVAAARGREEAGEHDEAGTG